MRLLLICLVLSMAAPVSAEDELASPYHGQTSTELRGLTEKEVSELRQGRGMGLARAAELNGYPGPRHVLDAVRAERLQLTPDQAHRVQRIFDDMSSAAQRLGNMVLEEERALEQRLRKGAISEPELLASVGRIATLQGDLRAVHLRAHLQTRSLLSKRQIERYDQLRGYTPGSSEKQEHEHRH
jgi:hypothetical protein